MEQPYDGRLHLQLAELSLLDDMCHVSYHILNAVHEIMCKIELESFNNGIACTNKIPYKVCGEEFFYISK